MFVTFEFKHFPFAHVNGDAVSRSETTNCSVIWWQLWNFQISNFKFNLKHIVFHGCFISIIVYHSADHWLASIALAIAVALFWWVFRKLTKCLFLISKLLISKFPDRQLITESLQAFRCVWLIGTLSNLKQCQAMPSDAKRMLATSN